MLYKIFTISVSCYYFAQALNVPRTYHVPGDRPTGRTHCSQHQQPYKGHQELCKKGTHLLVWLYLIASANYYSKKHIKKQYFNLKLISAHFHPIDLGSIRTGEGLMRWRPIRFLFKRIKKHVKGFGIFNEFPAHQICKELYTVKSPGQQIRTFQSATFGPRRKTGFLKQL